MPLILISPKVGAIPEGVEGWPIDNISVSEVTLAGSTTIWGFGVGTLSGDYAPHNNVYYAGQPQTGQTITVDFLENYSINSLIMHSWNGTYNVAELAQFKFEHSIDGSNWTDGGTHDYANENVPQRVYQFPTAIMRYARITNLSSRYSGQSNFSFALAYIYPAASLVYDDRTVLLLNGDGANDNSFGDHTLTNSGSAGTAAGKYGTAMTFTASTDSYYTIQDSDDWSLGSDPFTMEMWVNLATLTAQDGFVAIAGHHNSGATGWHDSWLWGFYDGDYLFAAQANNSLIFRVSCAFTPTINTWYHVAVERRSGSDWMLYIDGFPQTLDTLNDPSAAIPDYNGEIYVGAAIAGDGNIRTSQKSIEGFRIIKGRAKYQGGFTPPTDSLSGPTEHQGYYNVTKQYDNVIYVDTSNGDDTVGDGTIDYPYRTQGQAETISVDGDLISLTDATYDIGFGYNFPVGVDYVGRGIDTIIQGQRGSVTNNKFYRMQWDFNHVHVGASFVGTLEAYNVLFRHHYSTDSIREFVAYGGTSYLYNCVFADFDNGYTAWATDASVTKVNCASDSSTGIVVSTYNLANVTFDGSWNITDQTYVDVGSTNLTDIDGTRSDIGLFGGQYASAPATGPAAEGWTLVARSNLDTIPANIADVSPTEYTDGWHTVSGDYNLIRVIFHHEAAGIHADVMHANAPNSITWWQTKGSNDPIGETNAGAWIANPDNNVTIYGRSSTSYWALNYPHTYLMDHSPGSSNGLLLWGPSYKLINDVSRSYGHSSADTYIKVYLKSGADNSREAVSLCTYPSDPGYVQDGKVAGLEHAMRGSVFPTWGNVGIIHGNTTGVKVYEVKAHDGYQLDSEALHIVGSANAYGTDPFTVEISHDGVDWTSVHSEPRFVSGTKDIPLDFEAQYARFTVTPGYDANARLYWTDPRVSTVNDEFWTMGLKKPFDTTYKELIEADSPSAYYRMSDTGTTLTNEVGADGSWVGNPTHNSRSAILTDSDGSTYLNGSSTYANTGQVLIPGTLGVAYSFEFWMYLNQTPESTDVILSQYDNSGAYPGRGHLYTDSSLKVVWQTSGQGTIVQSSAITLNEWFHIAITVDASNNVILYKNGVQDDTSTITVPMITSYNTLLGALAQFAGTYDYRGFMDEVAFYNSVLTPAKVADRAARTVSI